MKQVKFFHADHVPMLEPLPREAPNLHSHSYDFLDLKNGQILIQDYLYKQANFKIKGWKPRWFILDATKHQLRYADTREDYRDKGYIDLSEVTGVCKVSDGGAAGAGAPKNAEGCMFELQTVRRTYCFCAKNRTAAHEWISKIQSCLSNE